MTSLRQLEANRRNALKSTGPCTENEKQRSRRNALKHGLTAETVIEPLESPEKYRVFEEAIVSEYMPQTSVEQVLVHRLVSLFWRLRRATSIETRLFQTQGEILLAFRTSRSRAVASEREDALMAPPKRIKRTGEDYWSLMCSPLSAGPEPPTPRAASPSATCGWPASITS